MSTTASTDKHKDQTSSFFVLALVLAFAALHQVKLNEIPLRRNTNTRIFTTRGYVNGQ